MRKTFEIGVVVLVWAVAGGCAFAPVSKVNYDAYFSHFAREKTYPMSSSDAMEISKKTLGAMGYEVQAVTPELGTILTKTQRVAIPALCDCGTWNFAPVTGSAESTLKVSLTEMGDSTRIVLEHGCGTTFSGQNLYGATTVRDAYRCASRGQIETDFWDKFDRIAAVTQKGK
jgi:hypothetical protein